MTTNIFSVQLFWFPYIYIYIYIYNIYIYINIYICIYIYNIYIYIFSFFFGVTPLPPLSPLTTFFTVLFDRAVRYVLVLYFFVSFLLSLCEIFFICFSNLSNCKTKNYLHIYHRFLSVVYFSGWLQLRCLTGF